MLDLASKSLEALEFDMIRVKKQNHRSQATAFEAGRFEIQKRSGFLDGEAVSSMENVGEKRLSTWKEC